MDRPGCQHTPPAAHGLQAVGGAALPEFLFSVNLTPKNLRFDKRQATARRLLPLNRLAEAIF